MQNILFSLLTRNRTIVNYNTNCKIVHITLKLQTALLPFKLIHTNLKLDSTLKTHYKIIAVTKCKTKNIKLQYYDN